ncbi:hypothetical protein [Coleofasciculus chthonoplastes]|uniref:Uncharacterized protein n=1 Tax=Coleofasciculus chthonoplastes PCC 7420 TaxID=118168 RepID=B4VW63_9CYAN|nr:hypothetical protein [Coleofasciculus chthonoplastes]EDX74020.1 hypothetical protein MC7420_5900 [Coleofasciculus chthonoplastes PCC 7420]
MTYYIKTQLRGFIGVGLIIVSLTLTFGREGMRQRLICQIPGYNIQPECQIKP